MSPNQRHMGRVAQLGCVVCRNLGYGETPAQVHHIRDGFGMSQRADDYLTIPLCPEHHTGGTGFHKNKTQFEAQHGTELELLAQTIRDITTGLTGGTLT